MTDYFLKFTVTIRGSDRGDLTKDEKVNIDKNKLFSFSDMEIFWSKDHIRTCIHLKPNQMSKYLHSDSTHTPSCFKSISKDVLK